MLWASHVVCSFSFYLSRKKTRWLPFDSIMVFGSLSCQFYKLHVALKQCKYNLFKWESKKKTPNKHFLQKKNLFFISILFASSNLFKLFRSYLIQFCVVFLNFLALPSFNRKKIVENLFICKNQNIFHRQWTVCSTLIFYNLKEVIDFVRKGLPMTGNYNSTYTLFFQYIEFIG